MRAAIRRSWMVVAVLAIVASLAIVAGHSWSVQLAVADDAAAVAAPVVTAPPLPGIIDAAGRVNWWLLVGTLGTVLWTNLAMALLKKSFPGWQSKGWAPPIIGLVTAVLGAAATGQVHDVATLGAWIIGGIGAGASASSLRDSMVGK